MLLFIYLSMYPSINPTRLEELEMRENFGKLTKINWDVVVSVWAVLGAGVSLDKV
jgi:hypothetical protein